MGPQEPPANRSGSSKDKRRLSPEIISTTGDGSYREDSSAPAKRKKRGRHAAACQSCHRRKQSNDSSRDRRRQGESVSDPPECPVGDLFKSRDAPSFFGSSYFGPQAAAKVIEAPPPDFPADLSHKALAGSADSFRDEGGPFSQIWDLLGLLPRNRSTVDRLTECFLRDLNWAIDAVTPSLFREKYEAFWSRKFGFDDFKSIDLRWLALLFIILAYGVLLDCPRPRNKEVQRELQQTSLRFYWAARRAIVIAPTFYGESTDLVRAGVLVTRYLIYARRVPESWLTTSFAMRMGMAQGMHIDGERWRLSRQKTETRRRLWSQLYTLDKTIALAIGRPFAIVDSQCLVKQSSNVWLDEMDEEEAANVPEQPLSDPTPSLGNRLSHELAIIVGKIQEHCFGLFAVSYDTVLNLDREILEWEGKLPVYFRLGSPDRSKDVSYPFLVWNRLILHSLYHFARVTLHRPFLLRQSITNRYRHSHEACITSACADLAMRLEYFSQPLADRLKWTLGAHHLFNSALVLGIIVVRDPFSRRSHGILEDLAAYCGMQRNDMWFNEFALAEVKIVELCIKKARQIWMASHEGPSTTVTAAALQQQQQPPPPPPPTQKTAPAVPPSSVPSVVGVGFQPRAHTLDSQGGSGAGESHAHDPFLGNTFHPASVGGPMMWDGLDPSYSFPETGDLLQWENVLNSIMQDQMG
ncbi:fungal-specific transcription factor domain-containing protein [Xylariomycetidae sp. FL2044]|nr:fungal-specific transcription factor domain-containing protein [Xylariomycetidae sp. FL2044]